MPATVGHALTATTPDDPAWEIRPSHWNSNHVVTLNAVGSEVSGAFSNAGNVSFGLSANGFITASANVTAAPSPVNVTGENGSSVNAQTIAFLNSNGVTLGVSTAANGASITASHNGLTTAAQSNHSHGNPTLALTNLTGTTASNSAGLTLSLSGNPAQSVVPGIQTIAFANTTFTTGAVQFNNANGISFGSSAGSVTASYTVPTVPTAYVSSVNGSSGAISLNVGSSLSSSVNGSSITFGLASNITTALQPAGNYLTTARASNDAIGLNTAQTNVTWTVNSSGLSINASGYAGTTTAVTGAASITLNSAGLQFNGSNLAGVGTSATNASITLNSNGLAISVAAPGGGGSSWTVSDNATSATVGRLAFTQANGVTMSLSTSNNGNHTVFASHNGLTTARASNDAIGLNTAGTNVTWTVNSSGLSLNAAGYAGTATTFNGANISGSITQNSAGLNLSLSVAAPGAAAENNNHNLLGANTAGNTTASGSTIGLSGINLTLSGTNGSQIVLSAPATSSLVGASGLSISTNGSTISAYPIAMSEWNNMAVVAVAGAAQGNSLVSLQPLRLDWPVVASNAVVAMSVNPVSTTNASSAYFDVSMSGVMYTRNVSTLSSLFSFSQTATVSWSSNATATVAGVKALSATFAGTTLTPGQYWLAVHVSTNNSATGGANTTALGNTVSMMLGYSISSNQPGFMYFGGATNNSLGLISGLGAASTGATRASYDLSAITVTGSRGAAAAVAFGMRNVTYQ